MHLEAWEYMAGQCHVFAIAAHRRTAWPIMAAMAVDEDAEAQFRGYGDVVHLFVVDSEGCRFDAFGTGEEPADYASAKGIELGQPVEVIDIDEAGIAELVGMGWLREFNQEDIIRAGEDLIEVMENEGVNPSEAVIEFHH